MFKFEEICELVRLVGSTRVGGVEIEHGGSRLRIDGMPPAQVQVPAQGPEAFVEPVVVAAAASPPAAAEAAESGADPAAEDGCFIVTSPIVGTFYRAPNPDADPYARVSDFVEKGQVLCIVEAMKLMNEIESDFSGTIVKILVENEDPVEFGQPLFTIRPV